MNHILACTCISVSHVLSKNVKPLDPKKKVNVEWFFTHAVINFIISCTTIESVIESLRLKFFSSMFFIATFICFDFFDFKELIIESNNSFGFLLFANKKNTKSDSLIF